jgi:hypothetical protein
MHQHLTNPYEKKTILKFVQDFFKSSLSNDTKIFESNKNPKILLTAQIYFLIKLLSYQQP